MNIFITGGTTGLGKQLAIDYAKLGYIVGICGRSPEKYNKSELVGFSNIHFWALDVSIREDCKKVIESYVNEYGPIDYLFANAGIGVSKKSLESSLEKDLEIVDINVSGFLQTLEFVIPSMIKRGEGKIIALSSLGALFGLPGNAAYCASKAFVKTYCESLSISLEKKGIQVTCILPGYLDTPLTKKNNHPMPFLMKTEKASSLIRTAVEKKKKYYAFPYTFSLLTHFLGRLPKPLLFFLLKRVSYR